MYRGPADCDGSLDLIALQRWAPALFGFLAITSTLFLSLVMLAAASLVSLVTLSNAALLVGLLVWGRYLAVGAARHA